MVDAGTVRSLYSGLVETCTGAAWPSPAVSGIQRAILKKLISCTVNTDTKVPSREIGHPSCLIFFLCKERFLAREH